jgi:hypothetical protein
MVENTRQVFQNSIIGEFVPGRFQIVLAFVVVCQPAARAGDGNVLYLQGISPFVLRVLGPEGHQDV